MSARDTLAREIFLTDNHKYRDQAAKEWDAGDRPEYVYGIADGLLKAGWTRPRTITTAQELDALPDGAVILSRKGHSFQRDDSRWCNAALTGGCPPTFIPLPATVLYEPTEES